MCLAEAKIFCTPNAGLVHAKCTKFVSSKLIIYHTDNISTYHVKSFSMVLEKEIEQQHSSVITTGLLHREPLKQTGPNPCQGAVSVL